MAAGQGVMSPILVTVVMDTRVTRATEVTGIRAHMDADIKAAGTVADTAAAIPVTGKEQSDR